MAELRIRTARHTIKVAAPPERVYQLIAQVNRWPQIFQPTVAVDHLGFDGTCERLRMWKLAGDEVQDFTTRRELNPYRKQVRYRHESSPHPLASMGGLWLVLPKGTGSSVVLDHYYRIVGDNPTDADWLAQALEGNSISMLQALRDTAELGPGLDDLWMTYSDSVDVDGDPRDVYDFLARAQDWPQRLPHVTRLHVEEDVPDIQQFVMDTRIPSGKVHTTNTVRVCFPESRIVYKQISPPPIMKAHTGMWSVAESSGGVRVGAEHTVLLRREAIADLLGPHATVAQARENVRQVLASLSRDTLTRAKAFAEARRPRRAA